MTPATNPNPHRTRPSIVASDAVEPDAASTTIAEIVQVRLGDRFESCADVQLAWDRNQDGLQAALAAVADHNNAVAALNDITDELDRAEALEQVDALEQRAEDLISAHVAVESSDTRAGTQAGLIDEIWYLKNGAEGTKGVAYTRAREAFLAVASPQETALLTELTNIIYGGLFNPDVRDRLSAAPLPPAVQASIGVHVPFVAQDRGDIPSADPLFKAIQALRVALDPGSGFAYNPGAYVPMLAAAADDATDTYVYAHLLDADLPAARRFLAVADADAAEAANMPQTVQRAYEAAAQAAADAYTAEYTAIGTTSAYQAAQAAAADRAAIGTIREARDALGDHQQAFKQAREAAFAEASDETTVPPPVDRSPRLGGSHVNYGKAACWAGVAAGPVAKIVHG